MYESKVHIHNNDEVLGIGGLVLADLFSHYGFGVEWFYDNLAKSHYCANGWPSHEAPTDEQINLQTTRLASILVFGPDTKR